MDLISVIVVTYNSEDTVIETLNSIKNQTYSNVELIVTDDCSKDSTRQVIRKWAKENKEAFANIKLVKTRINKGVTNNCNLGVYSATGRYVQLIAGDDILFPNALMEKYNYAEREHADYVYCMVDVFGSNRKKVDTMKKFCDNGYRIMKTEWNNQYERMLIDNYIGGPSGSFFKKEFLMDIGGFDNRFPFLEDYPLHIKILSLGKKLVFLEKVLCGYRISGTSLCTSENSLFSKSRYDYYIKVKWKLLLKNRMYNQLYIQTIKYINYCYKNLHNKAKA